MKTTSQSQPCGDAKSAALDTLCDLDSGRPAQGTAWKRFADEKPVYDGWGERHLLTWCVRAATYDVGCIDGNWSYGEEIDGHPDDLWRWLEDSPNAEVKTGGQQCLIAAAAPDLLAALKDLVQLEGGRFGTGEIKPGTYGAAVMGAARDAIAKAEGRSQDGTTERSALPREPSHPSTRKEG